MLLFVKRITKWEAAMKNEIENVLHNTAEKEQTYTAIRNSVISAQSKIYTAVNSAMVQAYWEIGEQIYLACGENDRAEYGKGLLKYLADKLTFEFGKGFTVRNLQMMRKFYLMYRNANTLCAQLSWSHYRILMRVSDEKRRDWYTEECAKAGWSVRQLERQINTLFYDRLLASKDKEPVANEIQKTEPKPEYEKIIRDPYVLEFLDLPQNPHFYEKNLEQALIDHLQNFLLELGRGFCFEARQKKISFDGRNFYIDLVFYNYLLKCFVLIDLKTTKISHQDVGQMDMYVRMYDDLKCTPGDNPTIGILLCSETSEDIAKYSMLNGSKQLFASKYLTFLPSEEELRQEIETQKNLFLLQRGIQR